MLAQAVKQTPSGSKYNTMHLPENLILVAVVPRPRGRGQRLYFRCPSQRDTRTTTKTHTFSVNVDGTNPRCTCPSFEFRGRCGLSDEAERVALMHRP
jgi:hypothetical protein